MDVKPPKNWRPATRPVTPVARPTRPVSVTQDMVRPQPSVPPAVAVDLPEPVPQDVPSRPLPSNTKQNPVKKKRRYRKWVLAAVVLVAMAVPVGLYSWAISPRSTDVTQQLFVVTPGENPAMIGRHLESQQLIRSGLAFELYTRLHQKGGALKSGTYRIAPNQSVAEIVEHLLKGQDGVHNVTILPGLTLKQLADPAQKGSLVAQGFSPKEISQAFAAQYTSPLLKDKPAEATLEGYIFPETFQVRDGDSLDSVLERSFNELYARLQSAGLLQKFTSKGLSLHQALTLASIVQKEVSDATIQPKVAQVFLRRLQQGMSLGSDVTFLYAAHQAGQTPTPDYPSPYNTRIHPGLPPGPIATSNFSALQAVASPADGDYLFFVAGDDGQVYFSRTNEEHEQLVKQHCHTLCSQL